MKKVISLFLALLMAFSVVTVAFATDAETTTLPESTTAPTEGEDDAADSIIPDLGEYDWILDLPFWTVGPAFKFAKIAFKLVSVYLKVAKIFGLVDKDMEDMILDVLLGLIENGGLTGQEPTEPEATEPEATTGNSEAPIAA